MSVHLCWGTSDDREGEITLITVGERCMEPAGWRERQERENLVRREGGSERGRGVEKRSFKDKGHGAAIHAAGAGLPRRRRAGKR